LKKKKRETLRKDLVEIKEKNQKEEEEVKELV